MKKTKQATTSSAVLSVFASKSLCCMPFCGYILYLSDGSPSQQNQNQSKSKIKKVKQKLSQQPKLPNVCSSISCDGIFFSHGAAPCYYHSTTVLFL
jgi:hypothetical protein